MSPYQIETVIKETDIGFSLSSTINFLIYLWDQGERINALIVTRNCVFSRTGGGRKGEGEVTADPNRFARVYFIHDVGKYVILINLWNRGPASYWHA